MSMPNLDLDIKERIKNRLEIKTALFVSESKFGSGVLASIGSSAPFIGLFGTVWGVMDSFASIGANQSVSIGVIAPGLAIASGTTALGLIVAIPAAIAHQVFSKRADELYEKIGGK